LSRAILRAPGDARPWEITPFHDAERDLAAEIESGPPHPEAMLAAAIARAAEISQHARREAEALRERAQAEAEQLRSAAQEEGFAAGQARAQEEWDALCGHGAALIDQLGTAYQSFCEAQVPALAFLAVAAAERLLLEQLTLEPERVVTIVNDALAAALATATVTVHLHPEDAKLVAAHLDAQRSTLDAERTLDARHSTLDSDGTGQVGSASESSVERRASSVVSESSVERPASSVPLERRASSVGRPAIRLAPDTGVERGGCWIESAQGEVDATVGGRLTRLAQAMGDQS
jgi:flagellar biosynthesis/type III secretory pathway protein FliH